MKENFDLKVARNIIDLCHIYIHSNVEDVEPGYFRITEPRLSVESASYDGETLVIVGTDLQGWTEDMVDSQAWEGHDYNRIFKCVDMEVEEIPGEEWNDAIEDPISGSTWGDQKVRVKYTFKAEKPSWLE